MTDTTLPQLIAEVSAALSRIEKRGTAPAMMGGFAFVRESDVIEALKPELDARGIVLRPDVELLRLDTFARSGKDMPNTVATISLALYAVRGAEEYLIARTVGQGADTQDKAVGKATTAAKKQGILVAFAIPTGDDPDASAIPERARSTQPGQGDGPSRTADVAPADPVPAPALHPGVDQPASPVVMAKKRYEWAALRGWSAEQLEQAAQDATNHGVGTMDIETWRTFAVEIVQSGPNEQGNGGGASPGEPVAAVESPPTAAPASPSEKVAV